MAAPECEREVRKRRERRDSGCGHERKERRPHSEERHTPPSAPPPPLHDYNRLESERRAERLSRARRPQLGGKRRRQPPRPPRQDPARAKENGGLPDEPARCDSPAQLDFRILKAQFYEHEDSTEGIDLAALHRQFDREEPVRSFAAERERGGRDGERERRSFADGEVCRPKDPLQPDKRLDKITKKISVLKKSIAKYESDFESDNGYAITLGERITDVQLTRMYETLRRLQAEKRCIKADPAEYALKLLAAKQQKERDERLDEALNSDKSMVDVVRDIEEWLEGCRQAAGRSVQAEGAWAAGQLSAEKACVQRALLRLEAARGRPPAHSADRGAARHLYERYRAVKRALASARPDAGGMLNGELATIHEHEAMLFNSVDSSSDSQEKPSDASQESQQTTDTPLQSPPHRQDGDEGPSTASSAKSQGSEEAPATEGLHCLGLQDLARALQEAKMHKCILRRTIKEYEVSFEAQNARKLQRDDKKDHEEYFKYKALKARIKLLNALINKQKT